VTGLVVDVVVCDDATEFAIANAMTIKILVPVFFITLSDACC
jgi:hypothetical protein